MIYFPFIADFNFFFIPQFHKKYSPKSFVQLLGSTSPGHDTYNLYEAFFRQNGLNMSVDMYTDSFALIMPMIEHNLGYSFMPEFIARDSIRSGKVFTPQLRETIHRRRIRMIYDSTYPLSVSGRMFLNTILDYVKTRDQKTDK